jgi:hypothetical protein
MQPICTHTISVQSAKPSHAYQIIRLPREFRRLAGAAATIYETTLNGALAFLVVPPRNRKGHTSDSDADIEKTSLYTAKVGRSNRLEPICFCNSFSDRTQQCSLLELSKSRQLSPIGDGDITERHCKTEEGACIPKKSLLYNFQKIWLWDNAADISLSS